MNRNTPAVLSSIVGLAGLSVYLTIIASQGGDSIWSILPFAGLMAIATGAAFAGGRTRSGRSGRFLLLGAAAIFGGIGLLAILSIGIVFVVAAVLAAIAAGRRQGTDPYP